MSPSREEMSNEAEKSYSLVLFVLLTLAVGAAHFPRRNSRSFEPSAPLPRVLGQPFVGPQTEAQRVRPGAAELFLEARHEGRSRHARFAVAHQQ